MISLNKEVHVEYNMHCVVSTRPAQWNIQIYRSQSLPYRTKNAIGSMRLWITSLTFTKNCVGYPIIGYGLRDNRKGFVLSMRITWFSYGQKTYGRKGYNEYLQRSNKAPPCSKSATSWLYQGGVRLYTSLVIHRDREEFPLFEYKNELNVEATIYRQGWLHKGVNWF